MRKVCKETKIKEFQFTFINRIVVTKKNYLNMVSKMTINACTAEKEIPLNTRLLTVYVLRLLRKKLYSGLIRKIRVMQISPTPVEILFGITSHEKSITGSLVGNRAKEIGDRSEPKLKVQ